MWNKKELEESHHKLALDPKKISSSDTYKRPESPEEYVPIRDYEIRSYSLSDITFKNQEILESVDLDNLLAYLHKNWKYAKTDKVVYLKPKWQELETTISDDTISAFYSPLKDYRGEISYHFLYYVIHDKSHKDYLLMLALILSKIEQSEKISQTQVLDEIGTPRPKVGLLAFLERWGKKALPTFKDFVRMANGIPKEKIDELTYDGRTRIGGIPEIKKRFEFQTDEIRAENLQICERDQNLFIHFPEEQDWISATKFNFAEISHALLSTEVTDPKFVLILLAHIQRQQIELDYINQKFIEFKRGLKRDADYENRKRANMNGAPWGDFSLPNSVVSMEGIQTALNASYRPDPKHVKWLNYHIHPSNPNRR